MIDMSKKYQTRDGRAVRILCVDGPGDGCPIIGLIEGLPLDPYYWRADGQARRFETDLFPVDIPVPTKHQAWGVVITSDPPFLYTHIFMTKEGADHWLQSDTRRGSVIHVTWES